MEKAEWVRFFRLMYKHTLIGSGISLWCCAFLALFAHWINCRDLTIALPSITMIVVFIVVSFGLIFSIDG